MRGSAAEGSEDRDGDGDADVHDNHRGKPTVCRQQAGCALYRVECLGSALKPRMGCVRFVRQPLAARQIRALRGIAATRHNRHRGGGHVMDPRNPEAICYRFGDVEVDLRRHCVLRSGAELALEPKAYAVLVELLRRAGGVVGRDALLDAVWGHRHVTPAVLNRIIALLRRELGDSADHPHLIRTVHGVGYEFFGAVLQELRETSPVVVATADATGAGAPVGERLVSPSSVVAASPPTRSPPSRTARGLVPALLALVAMLVVVLAWSLLPRPRPAAAPATAMPVRSIAVLPLVDAGGEADRQVFVDGLSENLITTLSQYKDLKVIGRSSSFLFRGSREGAAAIAAKLGVAHLVEGSVQRVGDDVRVSVELIHAADSRVVWTRRFDRPYTALFALQDEIALAVAGALQVNVLHAMPSMVEAGRPASGNLDAYEAYLRATANVSGSDLVGAIKQFAQATRIDPGYAQAWSWLGFARTQYARGNRVRDAARAGYAQARKDIDTALRLAPDFGQAHAIRANLLSAADHDWNGALAEFHTALQLVPENDPSHGAVSRLLATLGRIDEAIMERRKYITGDPLAAFARVYLAELLACRGRLDEAAASLRAAVELSPEPDDNTHDWHASQRSHLAILRGDAATALAEADSMVPNRWRERTRALALQIGSDRAAADEALQHLVETAGQEKGDAYAIARVHALRGDAGRMFEWLQRDAERDDTGVHRVLFDPLLLRFRDDARFAAYCRTAGLPPPTASESLDVDRIRRTLALSTGQR